MRIDHSRSRAARGVPRGPFCWRSAAFSKVRAPLTTVSGGTRLRGSDMRVAPYFLNCPKSHRSTIGAPATEDEIHLAWAGGYRRIFRGARNFMSSDSELRIEMSCECENVSRGGVPPHHEAR